MSAAAVTTTDDVLINVHGLGTAGGAPVVLAHGTGMHGLVWSPVAEHLRSDLDCLSFDARGHGDSGRDPGDPDWHRLGTDVLAVVDGLGLSKPFGAGHSMGASALLLAEQSRPGTFASLYCFEPAVVAADPPLGRDPDSWLAGAARRRRETFASRAEACKHYSSRYPFASVPPDVVSAYVDHALEDLADGTVRLKCRREDEAALYEMATAHDCFVNLGKVRCPVMIAWGGETDHYHNGTARPMADRLGRPSLASFCGIGHLGPLEAPERVAASMRSFFLTDGAGTMRRERLERVAKGQS